jgi:hypothetical protein
MKVIKLIAASVLIAFTAYCQENTKAHKPMIRGAIMMANSHVPQAIEGNFKGVIIPTWGLDVDYFFHKHWSAALQGDIKLQSFEIEEEHAFLERTNPIALVGVLHYHFVKHWSIYAGPGIELDKTKNLLMMRFGSEYSFEINENFEIALNLNYENKLEVYDALTFGIAFNKKLWSKK